MKRGLFVNVLIAASSVVLFNVKNLPPRLLPLWVTSFVCLVPLSFLVVSRESVSLLILTTFLSFLAMSETVIGAALVSVSFTILGYIVTWNRPGFSIGVCLEMGCAWTVLLWSCSSIGLIGLTDSLASMHWLMQPLKYIGFYVAEGILASLNILLAGLLATGISKYVKAFLGMTGLWSLLSLWLFYNRRLDNSDHHAVNIALVSGTDRHVRYELAAEAVGMGADVLVWLPGWVDNTVDCMASVIAELGSLSMNVNRPILTDCVGSVFVTYLGTTSIANSTYQTNGATLVMTKDTDLNDPSHVQSLMTGRRDILLHYGDVRYESIVLRAIENHVAIVNVGETSTLTDSSGQLLAAIEQTDSPGDLVMEQLPTTRGTSLWPFLHATLPLACAAYLLFSFIHRRLLHQTPYYTPLRVSSTRRSLVSLIDNEPLAI